MNSLFKASLPVCLIVASAFLLIALTVQGQKIAHLSREVSTLSEGVQDVNRLSDAVFVQQAAHGSFQDSSLASYVQSFRGKPIPEELNAFIEQRFIEVFRIDIGESCDPQVIDICNPITRRIPTSFTVLSNSNWNNGQRQVFYIESSTDGPPAYYGPFYDDIERLLQESKAISSR